MAAAWLTRREEGGEAVGAAAGEGSLLGSLLPGGPGGLVGGVVGAALVPLHVPDAPDRLDLGVLGAKL